MNFLYLISFFAATLLYPSEVYVSAKPQEQLLPCSTAIEVALGDVDERFNLSRSELEDEIREVAQFWSAAAGTAVVVYDENAGIPIHFVYEDQQELTDQERELRNRIQSADAHAETMEKELRDKERRYQREASAYEEDSAVLAERIDRLNQWVRKVNDKGGFNEDELRQYHYRKQGVDESAEALERKQEWIHQTGIEISGKVLTINRHIEEKNQLIDEYNSRFSGVHHVTQGVYEWNAVDRAIHIYQFDGREELRMVLAHEIGHALGINHVEDENSVMHHAVGEQQRSDLQLTEADIRALREVCGSAALKQERD